MQQLTVIVELSREETAELERIADETARCAFRERMDYVRAIFEKLRRACIAAKARHVLGESEMGAPLK